MFGRKKPPTQKIETLIGPGTRIEGNLIVTGGVHLEGYVKGNVATGPDGTAVLSIGSQGVVEGIVEVPRVIVHGEVRGDIRARDKVELGASARVSGNVSYGVIEMAAGAVIQGRLVAPASPQGTAAEAGSA
jgi:cytoskeletal protein CcmA (bactofilin family)